MTGEQVEDQIHEAEQLIVRADAVLAEAGFVIEAQGYEDYADALRMFLREGQLTEAQTQELEGIGDVVRKVAHAAGAVKGAHAGLKTRWHDFKASVKGAFAAGHKKGFDKTSGRKSEPAKEPEKKEPAKAAEPAKAPETKKKIAGKLRRVKAAPAAAAPAKKGRGAMSDKEYKARYGHARAASRGQRKKRSLKLVASMEALADFEKTTGVNLEAASVAAWEMLGNEKLEGGEKFAALSKELAKKPGIEDPDALAAAIGREKYGKEKFQKMAAAGRKEDLDVREQNEQDEGKKPTHVCAAPLCTKGVSGDSDYCKAHQPKEELAAPVSEFRRLSGLVSATNGWKLGQ